jgi:hypothetical protein
MKINLKLLMVALREVGGRSRTKGREDGLLRTRDFGSGQFNQLDPWQAFGQL